MTKEEIEKAIAKDAQTRKHDSWHPWRHYRDNIKEHVRLAVDDKMRMYTQGALDFEVSEFRGYVTLKMINPINQFDQIIFYEMKEDKKLHHIAVKDGKVIPRGTMLFGFAEALN